MGNAQVDDTGRVDEGLLDSLEHDLREPRRRRTRRKIQRDSDMTVTHSTDGGSPRF